MTLNGSLIGCSSHLQIMDTEADDGFNVAEARRLVTSMNRKKKKAGGFQAMGLSDVVYKGIMKKGFKLPTPIQRKVITFQS